jgi:chromosome segregation ATPase
MSRNDDVDIPSLTLDQDEVSERRTANSQNKRKLNPPPAHPAGVSTGRTSNKTSLGGVYFLLLLILAGAGGAGYWLWEQNQMLLNELQLTKSEVKNLDHQLIAADVSANAQGSTLEETLNVHSSEIRKLWAVAYDTNRKTIASNRASIDSISSTISSLKETTSTQAKLIAVQGDAFNEIEAGYNQLIEAVSVLEEVKTAQQGILTELTLNQDQFKKSAEALDSREVELQGRVEANSVQLTSYESEISALTTKLDDLSKKVASLANNSSKAAAQVIPNDVQKTLKDHQEAIDSVDAFRAQINTSINRLESQVLQIQLQQQLEAEAP